MALSYPGGFLGPFPVRELNIIEINDYGWGQAPPGTLFITQEAFNPIMGEANQLFSGGVNHRFAHEIAHQYWGTVVKSPGPEEQWLEESFAEYCAALFIRDAKGKGDFEMLVARWKSRAKIANDVAPIALANRQRTICRSSRRTTGGWRCPARRDGRRRLVDFPYGWPSSLVGSTNDESFV